MINSEYVDNRLLKIFSWVSRFSAIGVAVVGALIIVGQLADMSSIKFGTGALGICFILSAVSLCCVIETRFARVLIGAGYLAATLVLALALLNIGRYFFGIELANSLSDLKIGSLEVARFVTMSPSDAVGLSLIGVSLLMMHLRIGKLRPTELLTFGAIIISVMTLLGVLLKVDTFCVFMSCTRISPIGGLTFALLCLGVLLAKPTQGMMALAASRNAGGIMIRGLIPAALGIPVLLSWIRMQMQQAGVVDDISLAVMISAMVVVFSMILWWSAWSLEQIDTSRQRAAASLLQSELRNKLIIQQAIDAFIAIDVDGKIRDWNDRSEYTFGWSRPEVLGKSLFECVVPERFKEGLSQGLRRLGREGAGEIVRPLEAVALHKDGHEFPVEISTFPVLVEGEKMICGFVSDITERKEVEQRFKEFYSTVSHELRSPLTAVQNSIFLVQELCADILPPPSKRSLKTAESSLERLIRLINDLLDVRRIEEGALNLELQPLDPNNVANLAVTGVQSLATNNKIELKTEIKELSVFSGDADRIVQVLTNLISNAIKFAPEETCIIVRAERARNPKRLRFSVVDQGPGIPSTHVQKLFSKFGQLADGRKKLGTGLGLAISKAIVEEHNGEIGVESTLGQGTTFWFELPLSVEPDAIDPDQMTTLNFKTLNLDPSVIMMESSTTLNKEKDE